MFCNFIRSTSVVPTVEDNQLQRVYQQGLFAPYEAALAAHDEPWMERIKSLAAGAHEKISDSEKLLCHLFAVSIDPSMTAVGKRAAIAEKISESVYYSLGRIPAVMSANILRYCSQEVWENVCKLILKHRSIRSYERPFFHWFQEMAANQWSIDEKLQFLAALFAPLPSAVSDDLLYYYLMQGDSRQFPDQPRLNTLQETVINYGKGLQPTQVVRIPYKENQRLFFLAWFLEHLNSPGFCWIAAGLDENDWKWCFEKKELAPQTVKWMIEIAEKIGTEYDVFISCFYRYASERCAMEESEAQKFGCALTAAALFHYCHALKDSLRNQVIQHVVQQEPRKLIGWLDQISAMKENSYEGQQDKISKLFDWLAKAACVPAAIAILFDPEQNQTVMLTTYCAVDQSLRKDILTHLLKNRTTGMNILANWVELCVKGEVKPYLNDALAENFCPLLEQIDPSIPAQLNERLEVYGDFINLILPVGFDLTDRAVRQKQTLLKLKRNFLTKEITRNERSRLVSGLEPLDLPTLFQTLPKETRPLIFVHFSSLFSRSFYFAYGEEKSHGGMYLNAKGEETKPEWTEDKESWIELAAITLTQMVANPYVKRDDAQLALQTLYQTACETKTIHSIVKRFCEITPPAHFIAVMNLLGNSGFYYNRDGFTELVSTSLEKIKDKTLFIAKCLKEHEPDRHHGGMNDLDHRICKPPYLKNKDEVAQVGKHLVQMMQIQFLSLLFQHHIPMVNIIESWAETDRPYCEQIFREFAKLIPSLNNEEKLKFSLFNALGKTYLNAGLDVRGWLPEQEAIQKWYSLEEFILSPQIDLRLLHLFNPGAVPSAVLKRIESLTAQEGALCYYELEPSLKTADQLGYKAEIERQLFQEKPALLQALKKKFDSDIHEAFSNFSPHIASIAAQAIPDWKERLAQWVKEEVAKEKEEMLQYGGEPSFYQVVSLFKSLDPANLLKPFLPSLQLEKGDFQKVMAKFILEAD